MPGVELTNPIGRLAARAEKKRVFDHFSSRRAAYNGRNFFRTALSIRPYAMQSGSYAGARELSEPNRVPPVQRAAAFRASLVFRAP
jgi:hypothetical protein